ncbi:2-iminobutanoate/2-iminopropanoate deaminase [Paraburkholderia kururiensis]
MAAFLRRIIPHVTHPLGNSMIDAVNPSTVWSPFGPFSMAALQGDGQIVHLKGQVSLDQQGKIVGRGNMHAQVRQTLENIRAVMASMGGDMSDVFSLVHYTTDIDAFMRAGEIRNEYFAAPWPVTTTVQVVRLYHQDLLIEITATAEIPRSRFRRPAS